MPAATPNVHINWRYTCSCRQGHLKLFPGFESLDLLSIVRYCVTEVYEWHMLCTVIRGDVVRQIALFSRLYSRSLTYMRPSGGNGFGSNGAFVKRGKWTAGLIHGVATILMVIKQPLRGVEASRQPPGVFLNRYDRPAQEGVHVQARGTATWHQLPFKFKEVFAPSPYSVDRVHAQSIKPA